MFRLHSENSQVLFNILSTVFIGGINFFTIPLFTSLLGTAGFGEYSLYAVWVQIFTVVIGLQSSGTIPSASIMYKGASFEQYFRSIVLLLLMVFALGFCVSIVFINKLCSFMDMAPITIAYMLFQSFGAASIGLFNSKYIFEKKAQLNCAISVILCIATTLLSILLIYTLYEHDRVQGRIVGLVVPNLLIGLVLVFTIVKKRRLGFRKEHWAFCLSLSLPLVFHTVGQTVLSQTDKIMLQWILGDMSIVGIYSLGVTISLLLNTVYSAFNSAFVPFLFEDLQSKNDESLEKRYRSYIRLFTLGTILFILISPEIISIMAGEDYKQASYITPILILGGYFIFCYSFPVNYEFFLKKTKNIAFGTAMAAICNIALNIVLIPAFSMIGAAISTALAYGVLFLFHGLTVKHLDRACKMPFKKLILGTVLVCISVLFTIVLIEQQLARLLVSVLVAVMIGIYLYREKRIF